MVARLPIVVVAGQLQQMQSGDSVDASVVPGTNNGDLALIMVAQLVAQVAAGGDTLIDSALLEMATLIESRLPASPNPLTQP